MLPLFSIMTLCIQRIFFYNNALQMNKKINFETLKTFFPTISIKNTTLQTSFVEKMMKNTPKFTALFSQAENCTSIKVTSNDESCV